MNNPESFNPNNKIQEILAIKAQINTLGANDAELGQIDEIIEDIKTHKLSQEEGLAKAINIRDSKMDYH